MAVRVTMVVLGCVARVHGSSFKELYGPSSGCGQDPPYDPSSPRQSAYFEDNFDGNQRGYLMHLPTTYDQNRPTPLVISFHGWSLSSQDNWEWMGFKENIEQENYITIFPDGIRDCLGQAQCWSSWNAVGSSFNGADGPEGWTCQPGTANSQACADSCQPLGFCNSQNNRNCNWATCVDDSSFVEQLLDRLEAQLCVDRARVFASGESMGGMMAFELGHTLAHRFAAVAPTVAAPHRGFNTVPSSQEQISLLSLWAVRDNTIPPGGGASSDGWFWTSVADYTAAWGEYNRCSGGSSAWPNPVGSGPGGTQLDCQRSQGECDVPGADVIDCSFNGNHFTSINDFFGELAWFFFETHPKTETWYNATKLKAQSNRTAAMH